MDAHLLPAIRRGFAVTSEGMPKKDRGAEDQETVGDVEGGPGPLDDDHHDPVADGMDRIAAYEHDLLVYGAEVLESIDGVRIIGTAKEKASVLSFWMDSAHPHDIGQILDGEGIAIRAGHHCAQPVMQRFDIPATARASLAFYNTKEELDALGAGILKVKEVFE